jgi:hypothetical protein
MRVPINHKKVYYIYYTSSKFLTLKLKFQVKSSDIPPPQTLDASLRPWWLYFETDFSFKIFLVFSSKWILIITYSLFLTFWRQGYEVIYPPKSISSKNKISIRFIRMICCMFMGYLVQTRWKWKKLKHTGTFACIFDRHAKKCVTDGARRYVGWWRGSLRFQHITLIQEILAITWTCSRLRLRWMTDNNNLSIISSPRANLKCFF